MARFANIRAVTFDAGGTLLEPWPSVGAVYAAVAAEHGWRDLSAAQLDVNFVSAWRANADFDYSTDAWRQIVEESFAGLVNRGAVHGFFDDLYARFAEPDCWRVYPDVRPALDQLRRRGLRLAVISNWDLRLGPLLNRLGLADYFDAVVISAEVGATKPSARIFEEAASRLRFGASEILHVGDAGLEDLNGARAAGFAALRIDRRSISADQSTIPRLTDLDSML